MTSLREMLFSMPVEDVFEIRSSLHEADIARQLGNKRWRKIFKVKRDASRGKKKKIYAALYKNASDTALDAAWQD